MELKTPGRRDGQLRKLAIIAFILVCVVTALVVVSCAPRQTTVGEGKGDKGTDASIELPAWSLQSDCLSCHNLEADSATNTSTLYGFHTSVGLEQTCITCHNEEEKLVKVHEKNSASKSSAKKLTKTQVSSKQCLGCHQIDEIIAITAGTNVLTDVNGKAVNPHQLPQSSDHEAINCSDCHKMHVDKSALFETAMETCVTCHHEKVFECGTCH